jgi:hypothetical protein
MKINKSFAIMLGLFAMCLVFVSACKDDDDPVIPPVDKSVLKTALDAANALYLGAKEGTAVGSFEVGSKAVFKTAIGAGQAIHDKVGVTASEISNAAVNLGKAAETFTGKKVPLKRAVHFFPSPRQPSGTACPGTKQRRTALAYCRAAAREERSRQRFSSVVREVL